MYQQKLDLKELVNNNKPKENGEDAYYKMI
jgi:hypothetical protein